MDVKSWTFKMDGHLRTMIFFPGKERESSRKMAEKLFGKTSPLGKIVVADSR